MLFLTKEELINLTAYKTPSAQCRWLRREGFTFRIAADGKPRVLRQAVLLAMGGAAEQVSEERQEPNWAAFK
jgi:hypothetical protein